MGAIKKNRLKINAALLILLVGAVIAAGFVSKTSSNRNISLCGVKQICYNHHTDLNVAAGSLDFAVDEEQCVSCNGDCNCLQCDDCKAEIQSTTDDVELNINNI